jgi:pimeloyl-ACP methyl ester carboxylesterase
MFRGRLPYVRLGRGVEPLLVLPGLALTNGTPSQLTVAAWGLGVRRLAAGHAIYVVQRPHGIPAGASTRDLAAEYAPILHDELGGRARLLGLSTGGLIAQHVALDNPEVVERVALVVAGAHLAPAGRQICERWQELADTGQWRRLHGDLAAEAVDGPVARLIARGALELTGRAPTAQEAADFATVVAAVLAHDTRGALAALAVPALVLGGADDPFFPEAVLRATAAAAPDARLGLFAGCGHGLPKQRTRGMQDELLRFFGKDPN